jgi:hypothetical protein
VKEGYRFLCVPANPPDVAWQRILDNVLGEISPNNFQSTPQFIFGTLYHSKRPFIACTFFDPGPLPDPDERRPVSHTFIWFASGIQEGMPPDIPEDWHRQIFRLLLPVRDQFYEAPLSQPVVEKIRNSLALAKLELGSTVSHAEWVNRGVVDDSSQREPSRSRTSSKTSRSTNTRGREQSDTRVRERSSERRGVHVKDSHCKKTAVAAGAIGGVVVAVVVGAPLLSAGTVVGAVVGAAVGAKVASHSDDE